VITVDPVPREFAPNVIEPPDAAVPTEAGSERAGPSITVAAPIALDGIDTVMPLGNTVTVDLLTVDPSRPEAVTVSW